MYKRQFTNWVKASRVQPRYFGDAIAALSRVMLATGSTDTLPDTVMLPVESLKSGVVALSASSDAGAPGNPMQLS